MTTDLQLKLQAHLDGELPAAEAAAIAALLERDSAARALLTELRHTKSALAGNEPALALPESREFYWSKIRREIERQDLPAPAPQKLSLYQWLHRHLLPVSGVAMLACLLGIFTLHPAHSGAQLGEMELSSDDMGAYTYRDPKAQMTVVWFYDKNADSQFTPPESVASVAPK